MIKILLNESDPEFSRQDGISRMSFWQLILGWAWNQMWGVGSSEKFGEPDLASQGDPVVHVPNVGQRLTTSGNTNLKTEKNFLHKTDFKQCSRLGTGAHPLDAEFKKKENTKVLLLESRKVLSFIE